MWRLAKGNKVYTTKPKRIPRHRCPIRRLCTKSVQEKDAVVKESPWSSVEKQRKFLQRFATANHFTSLEDWYNVKWVDFIKFGGKSLLNQHNGSLQRALSVAFPHHVWEPWRFAAVRRSWWADIHNQRMYLEHVAKQLGLQRMEDWYKVQYRDLVAKHGVALLSRYRNSLSQLLSTVYSEHKWEIWRFKKVPPNYWRQPSTLRSCFDSISSQLGIEDLEQWYTVPKSQITEIVGTSLLRQHGNSLYKALSKAYPEHKFYPWRFIMQPFYWKRVARNGDIKVVTEFLQYIGEKLKVGQDLNGWYAISPTKQLDSKTLRALKQLGGLYNCLRLVYPNHPWDPTRFTRGRSSKRSQQALRKSLLQQQINSQVV